MKTISDLQTELSLAIATPDMSEADKLALKKEVGTVVVEGAVLEFMTQLVPDQALAFESWVAEHAETKNFEHDLLETYPEFLSIIRNELTSVISGLRAA